MLPARGPNNEQTILTNTAPSNEEIDPPPTNRENFPRNDVCPEQGHQRLARPRYRNMLTCTRLTGTGLGALRLNKSLSEELLFRSYFSFIAEAFLAWYWLGLIVWKGICDKTSDLAQLADIYPILPAGMMTHQDRAPSHQITAVGAIGRN